MAQDQEQRAQLLKGILSGGMVLVGLATGSDPFFTLLVGTSVGVGGNILASVAEKSFDNWRGGWFTPNGMLQDDIRAALQKAFLEAVQQLEKDWRNQPHYNYLKYTKELDRARFSITLIQEFRDESHKLFEGEMAFLKNFGASEFSDDAVRDFLEDQIEKYFGAVESLAAFAKVHLPGNWVLRFNHIIRDEKGTRAWRACQQLWQHSLSVSLTEIEQSSKQSQHDIAQIGQDIGKISQWLADWKDSSAKQPDMGHDLIGKQELMDSLQPYYEEFGNRLSSLQQDTRLIIELFRNRFSQLDFEQVMTTFLQKELLGDENVNLEQAGHHSDEDISLSQVFIDLPVSNNVIVDPPQEELNENKLPPGIIAEIVEAAKIPLDPKSLSLDDELGRVRPGEQPKLFQGNIDRQGRFVLIGGPGQGKSTTTQLACQLFRAAILKEKPHHQLIPKVKAVIKELESLCIEEGIVFPVVPRFPIRIVLSDFAEKLAKKEGINSLLTYIADRIQAKTNQDVLPDVIRKWLGEYPWLLVLDGLDEVPASSNRDHVLSAVDEFWIDANSVNADVLIVATTRPQGYNKDFAPSLYQHKYLTPLSNIRAEHYAARLVKVRYRQDEESQQKVFERLQRALSEETTARLMQSPLQVTIMTALLRKRGTPPQERWSLFSQYYEVIYQRETERNIPASTILREYQPDINAIHYRVGLLIQIESEYPERTGARLSKDRFTDLVDLRLREEGHEGQGLYQLREQIIEAAANRLVFLVGVEADQIGFEIRSLQEFMAAEALMEGSDVQIRDRLQKIAPIAHWRNVFLFAAGRCFVKQQHLRDTIHVICDALNETDEANSQAAALTKTGSQLAIDLLADGTVQKQPNHVKMLARKALRLLGQLPNQHQLRLADVYESGLEDIYKQELNDYVQTASSARFGAWVLLSALSEKGIAWANQFSEKCWPQKVHDRLDLLNAIVGDNDWWFWQRLNYDLLHLSASNFFEHFSYPRLRSRTRTSRVDEMEWITFLDPRPNTVIEAKLNIIDDSEYELSISFTSIAADNISFFCELTNIHADWLPFQMAAKFVANPSREVLGSIIRDLRGFSLPETGNYVYRYLPWPLAALLEEAQISQDHEQIANDVQQGKYGDLEQWSLAERRWQEYGISIRDLQYMVASNQLFDQNVDKIGCSLVSNMISISHGYTSTVEVIKTYRVLSSLSSECLHPYFATRLNSLKDFVFRVFADKPNVFNLLTSDEFLDMLSDATRPIPLTPEVISTVWANNPTYDFVRFINMSGKNCRLSWQFDDLPEQMEQTLVTEFINDPQKHGVFIFLSRLATRKEMKSQIPHQLLSIERYNDNMSRQAALILQLAQQEWQHFPAKGLALNVYETSKEGSEVVWFALQAITANKVSGAEMESFLIALYYYFFDDAKWEQAREIWEAIDNQLGQRHSNLVKNWADLGLPQGLDKLVKI